LVSRAGKYKTSKLTALCDDRGETKDFDLEKGGRHDCKAVLPILPKLPKSSIVTMDRGYDDKKIRRKLWKQGIQPVIPRRKTKKGKARRTPKPVLYKQRWVVEQHFSRYDQFRKLQTRYERNPYHYKAYWYLAASYLKGFQLTG
jgi:transposase